MSVSIADSLLRLNALGKSVRAIKAAPVTFERCLPRYPTVSASFAMPDFNAQQPTWKNDGHDFYMTCLRYSVWAHSTNQMWRMTDNGGGMTIDFALPLDFSTVGTTTAPMFDFGWNIKRIKSRQWIGMMDGQQAGEYGSVLSRSVLGAPERNLPLRWENPWPIKTGDGVAVRIQPLRFSSANFTSDSFAALRFSVHMTLEGFWGYSYGKR